MISLSYIFLLESHAEYLTIIKLMIQLSFYLAILIFTIIGCTDSSLLSEDKLKDYFFVKQESLGKWGLIDKTGKYVANPQFDSFMSGF